MYGSSTMKDHYSKFRSKVTTNHHVKIKLHAFKCNFL